MSTIDVHIGLPRCASTTIQRILRDAPASEWSGGTFVPPFENPHSGFFNVSGHVAGFAPSLSADGDGNWDLLSTWLELAEGKNIALSTEVGFYLADDVHRERLDRLLELVSDAGYDCHFHMVVREPVDWLLSVYSQEVARNFETRSFLVYAAQFDARPGRSAGEWRSAVGSDHIHLHRFESVVRDPVAWVYSKLIRCRPDHYVAEVLGQVQDNRALTTWELAACRIWNSVEIVTGRSGLRPITLGDLLRKFPRSGTPFDPTELDAAMVVRVMGGDLAVLNAQLRGNAPLALGSARISERIAGLADFNRVEAILALGSESTEPPFSPSEEQLAILSLAVGMLGPPASMNGLADAGR